MDYWYITNKFEDQSNLDDDTGGGIGFAIGGGFEFPIEIKKTYIGVEFLFHGVNFHDKFTQKFRPSMEVCRLLMTLTEMPTLPLCTTY